MGPLRQPPDPDPEPGRPDRALEVLDQGQGPARQRRLTASPSAAQLHRFCQLDFAFPPGPADGRYLVRGQEGVADVIAVTTVGAPVKRDGIRRRSGRPRAAEPGDEAEPVAITRVTVIRGDAFDDLAAAREWLARCHEAERASREVGDALLLLNRAVHAHRVAAADPYATELSLGRARRIRLGYGRGDELVEGRWGDALALPPDVPRGRRRRMLAPEEQVARILGGRRPTYPSEDLLLRARLDFDQGRTRAAALQARSARDALDAELRGGDAAGQLGAPAALMDELASAALARELTDAEITSLGEALVEMERITRRRRHAAEDG